MHQPRDTGELDERFLPICNLERKKSGRRCVFFYRVRDVDGRDDMRSGGT
jgi:hypothetical protein